jgi:hypothetical protein
MKKQTPLEKLVLNRKHLEEQSCELEHKLSDTVVYAQGHSGRLLLSGVASLIASGTSAPFSKKEAGGSSFPFSLVLSFVWNVAKPILISWGMGRAQSALIQWLLKSRKTK